jgi:hypothetical protein
MSNFAIFLDALRTRLEGVVELSTKTLIPNPYDVGANPSPLLRDGYGIIVQASAEGFGEFNTSYDNQGIGILLSKEILKTENNPEPAFEVVKTMKSDSFAVRKALLETLVTGAVKIDYLSTDEFTFSDQFVSTVINFNVTISDVIAIC